MRTLERPVYIPADLLVELGERTGHFWSHVLELEPVIHDAIRAWLHPAPPAQPDARAITGDSGYQWSFTSSISGRSGTTRGRATAQAKICGD